MARADEFKALAQDITASFDERIAALASIKKEIHEMTDDIHRMMDDIHRERSEMASQLRKDLTRAKSTLKKETGQLVKGFKKEHDDAVAAWGELNATMSSKRGGAVRRKAAH